MRENHVNGFPSIPVSMALQKLERLPTCATCFSQTTRIIQLNSQNIIFRCQGHFPSWGILLSYGQKSITKGARHRSAGLPAGLHAQLVGDMKVLTDSLILPLSWFTASYSWYIISQYKSRSRLSRLCLQRFFLGSATFFLPMTSEESGEDASALPGSECFRELKPPYHSQSHSDDWTAYWYCHTHE